MSRKHRNIFFSILILVSLFLISPTRVFAQTDPTARVGFFEPVEIPLGERVEVPIQIKDVENLYAIDLEIQFDPALLTVEDADTAKTGIQPALGTFLDAGMVLFDSVDPEKGLLRFVMTQVNPSEPKSGDGILLVLYLNGLKQGEGELKVTKVELSTRDGIAIPVTAMSSTITVGNKPQTVTSTPIPVQNSANLIIIPTLAPTQIIPTVQPVQTQINQTAVVSLMEGNNPPKTEVNIGGSKEITNQPSENDLTKVNQSQKFSLQEHWWIVLIVFGIGLALGIYLWKSNQPENQK